MSIKNEHVDSSTPEEEMLFALRTEAQRACLNFLIAEGKATEEIKVDPQMKAVDFYSREFEEIFDNGKVELTTGSQARRFSSDAYIQLTGIQAVFYRNIERKMRHYMLAAGLIKEPNEFQQKGYADALRVFLCGRKEDLANLRHPEPPPETGETVKSIQILAMGIANLDMSN